MGEGRGSLPHFFELFPYELFFMVRKAVFLKPDILAVTLLGAMLVWFTRGMIFTGGVPFFRDLGPYFYPMRFSLAESLGRGEPPLWDPHTGMGFPLLADFQSGAFYPPHLLFLVFPFFTAVKAIFLLHFLVAALGSYRLSRHWNFPPYLALVGALLFTLGGNLVSLSNLLNHFQAAVWLPWVLFFGEKLFLARSWKNFLIFTFILLIQMLAGSPEIYVLTMGLFLLDALRMHSAENGLNCGTTLALFVATNALATALALVQILPTLELFLQSRGHNPISYGENSLWSFHPLSLLNLLFLDKEIDPNVFSSVRLFFVREIPFFVSHYMGVFALVGVTFWFFFASFREKLVILAVAAVSLVLAMGIHTPAYPFLFKQMPFFLGLFRFPEKFFFFAYALLLFAALRGLSGVLQEESQPSKRTWLALFLIFALLLAIYLFCRFGTTYLIGFIARVTESPPEVTLRSSSGVLFYLERQVALLLGVVLLFYLWGRKKIRALVFKSLIIGVVFFDLTSAHEPYLFLLRPEFIWQNPRIVANPDPNASRIFYYPGPSNIHPSYYTMSKAVNFAEFQSLIFGNLFPNTGVFHRFQYMQELDALMRWPYRLFLGVASQLPPDRLYHLLGALNVRYISSLRPMPEGKITLVRHFPEYSSWLYRLERWMPRVYVVPKATEEKNPIKVFERLLSDGFDPSKEVMLQEFASRTTQEEFQGRAEIISYKNRVVSVSASLNGTGILVLADAFYPGWRVYINGREGEIFRANVFFRGVPLPAGDHLVEFRYEPRSLRVGLAMSLMTLLGVVGFTALRYFKIRR